MNANTMSVTISSPKGLEGVLAEMHNFMLKTSGGVNTEGMELAATKTPTKKASKKAKKVEEEEEDFALDESEEEPEAEEEEVEEDAEEEIEEETEEEEEPEAEEEEVEEEESEEEEEAPLKAKVKAKGTDPKKAIAAAKTVTKSDVVKVLQTLAGKKGREASNKILKEFKVKRVDSLKPADYTKVHKQATKALG